MDKADGVRTPAPTELQTETELHLEIHPGVPLFENVHVQTIMVDLLLGLGNGSRRLYLCIWT